MLSLAGILLYIAFRFQFSFAVGAVVATVHDLLVTLAFLAFFRYDLSLNVIAAILTVTGYSTNDTIVIFDRVRENMRGMRRDNRSTTSSIVSVNQTMSRTVITAGTALLSALALFFFGGDVLHGFAFTMIVGIVTGTYSSVFIAAAIAIIWQGHAGRPARRRSSAGRKRRTGTGTKAHAPPGVLNAGAACLITLLIAALLGVIQGLTEFLPVSSSAHLILARAFFGWDADVFGLPFDVALHVGTLVAVIAFFHEDVAQMIAAAPAALTARSGRRQTCAPDRHRHDPGGGGRRAASPTGWKRHLRTPAVIAVTLVVGALAMLRGGAVRVAAAARRRAGARSTRW